MGNDNLNISKIIRFMVLFLGITFILIELISRFYFDVAMHICSAINGKRYSSELADGILRDIPFEEGVARFMIVNLMYYYVNVFMLIFCGVFIFWRRNRCYFAKNATSNILAKIKSGGFSFVVRFSILCFFLCFVTELFFSMDGVTGIGGKVFSGKGVLFDIVTMVILLCASFTGFIGAIGFGLLVRVISNEIRKF